MKIRDRRLAQESRRRAEKLGGCPEGEQLIVAAAFWNQRATEQEAAAGWAPPKKVGMNPKFQTEGPFATSENPGLQLTTD